MSSRKRKRERRALEDHVNLMRAVRARRTLDLAQHLSARPEAEASESESVSSHGSVERRAWTRWPLVKGDAHVPEWTLFDEVEEIVGRFLRDDAAALDREEQANQAVAEPEDVQPPAVVDFEPEPMQDGDVDLEAPSDGEGGDEDEDGGEDEDVGMQDADPDDFIDPEDDLGSEASSSAPPLPLDALRDITDSTHAYLTRLLRTLALARPAVNSLLLRRLAPLDWVSVLEMAGAHGLADIETIQYVREVMEDIHGPAELKIIDRMRVVEARREELRAFAASHDHIDDEEPMAQHTAEEEVVEGSETEEDEELAEGDDNGQRIVKKRGTTRSRDLLKDDEARPVRSREIISDSEVSTTDGNAPARAQSTARISEVMSETDVSMPDAQPSSPAQRHPRPQRRASARLSRATSMSTRFSRATSMSTEVAFGDVEETPPVGTAPPSEDEDEQEQEHEQDPLAAGWRRGRRGDDEDDDWKGIRQRKRSLSRRASLPRARSRSSGV